MELKSPKIVGTKRHFTKTMNKKLGEILKKGKATESVCSICHEKKSCTIFEPCLHGGMCEECAKYSYISHNQMCSYCRVVRSF